MVDYCIGDFWIIICGKYVLYVDWIKGVVFDEIFVNVFWVEDVIVCYFLNDRDMVFKGI